MIVILTIIELAITAFGFFTATSSGGSSLASAIGIGGLVGIAIIIANLIYMAIGGIMFFILGLMGAFITKKFILKQ